MDIDEFYFILDYVLYFTKCSKNYTLTHFYLLIKLYSPFMEKLFMLFHAMIKKGTNLSDLLVQLNNPQDKKTKLTPD